MITVKQALEIQNALITQFGGTSGLRDRGALESALNRPFATFDGKELYPAPIEKAAAMLESIINNHPFIDGNKRTGYVLCRLLLIQSRLDIKASQEEKYIFVMNVSKGKWKIDEIKQWLSQKVVKNAP